MSELIQEYLNIIGPVPEFLNEYLALDSLQLLKGKGYFCGMDFASKDIYNFSTYVSRYDHSLTTSNLTYRFSKDRSATITALLHDYQTPCFSHVIDYMHGDYRHQETTERYGKSLLKEDKKLLELLKKDQLNFEQINPMKYSLVDNERPKLCADRIDGIILTSLVCLQVLNIKDVSEILNDLTVFSNEENEMELGFRSLKIAEKIVELNYEIDKFFHSNQDNFMMSLLAKITKLALEAKIISYDQLYELSETQMLIKLLSSHNQKIVELIRTFQTIKLKDIPHTDLPNVKRRDINPLVLGKRLIAKNN